MINQEKHIYNSIYSNKRFIRKDKNEVRKISKKIFNNHTCILKNSKDFEERLNSIFQIEKYLEKINLYYYIFYCENIIKNERKYLKSIKWITNYNIKNNKIKNMIFRENYNKIVGYISINYNLYMIKDYILKEIESIKNNYDIDKEQSIKINMLHEKKLFFNIINDNITSSIDSNIIKLFDSFKNYSRYKVQLSKLYHYNDAFNKDLEYYGLSKKIYIKYLNTVKKTFFIKDYIFIKQKKLKKNHISFNELNSLSNQESNMCYSYDFAKKTICNSLQCLGLEYMTNLNNLLKSNLIDYQNRTNKIKKSFTIKSYLTNPIIVLNYNSTIDYMFIFSHEIGHLMHGFFSKKNNYVYYKPNIFTSEIIAMVNEILLWNYMFSNSKSNDEKCMLLEYYLDNIYFTVFKQLLFSEFQKKVYTNIAKLTYESSIETYNDLQKEYYGTKIVNDKSAINEWLFEPHFYNDCYLFIYSISYIIATNIVEMITNNPNKIDEYLNIVKRGSKKSTSELLSSFGIDIFNEEYIYNAFKIYDKKLKFMLKILKKEDEEVGL